MCIKRRLQIFFFHATAIRRNSLGNDSKGMLNYTNFLGAIDSADNSEPYAPEFVRSNVEAKLRRQGFTLRFENPADIKVYGRVCDKPLKGERRG